MGKDSGTQTSTQAPWAPAQPSLQFGLNELNRIYGFNAPRTLASNQQIPLSQPVYTGTGGVLRTGTGGVAAPGVQPLFAGMARPTGGVIASDRNQAIMRTPPPQQYAMQQQPMYAPGAGGAWQGPQEYGLADLGAEQMRKTIQGDYMLNNPYLESIIQRSMGDVNSQFSSAGRYGSGAHMDQLFTQAAAPIRYANYEAERQRQLAATQAAPNYDLSPYQLYSARIQAPYENISRYLDLANTIGRGGMQTQTPIYRNRTAGALGGAASGAALGTAIMPGIGTGIGAVAGGLLGGFG